MSDQTAPEPRGRRTAVRRPRLSPTLLIGALLVLATAGALLLVRPHAPVERASTPTTAPLDAATRGCPAGTAGSTVLVTSAREDVEGEVGVRTGGEESQVDVGAGTAEVDGADPVVVRAEGALAPGLVAVRQGTRPLVATECASPVPETWFVGVGSRADHDGVLELVNPDAGPAVADVTVYASRGQRAVPRLLGLTVPPHDTLRLPLGEVVPRRSELALRVVVSRGRVAASLLDQLPSIGARTATEDWLPAQPEPTTDALHLGLPPGRGEDELTVANPGADEARVSVTLVTADSEFAPEGLDELRVPPGSVRHVSLSPALRTRVGSDALGIRVTASAPVLSSTRTVVAEDVSHTVPVTPVGGPVAAPVPSGRARLVLADADGVGTALVQPFAVDGRALEETTVELKPGQGGVVVLPERTAFVRVIPRRTSVHAAVVVTGPGGAAVLPLREGPDEALVPDVRPGLP